MSSLPSSLNYRAVQPLTISNGIFGHARRRRPSIDNEPECFSLFIWRGALKKKIKIKEMVADSCKRHLQSPCEKANVSCGGGCRQDVSNNQQHFRGVDNNESSSCLSMLLRQSWLSWKLPRTMRTECFQQDCDQKKKKKKGRIKLTMSLFQRCCQRDPGNGNTCHERAI